MTEQTERRAVQTSELGAEATALVRHVRETGRAVVLMEAEEPAAVLVSPDEFAEFREYRRFTAAVEQGLADADAGRVLSTDALKRSLEDELGPIAWR